MEPIGGVAGNHPCGESLKSIRHWASIVVNGSGGTSGGVGALVTKGIVGCGGCSCGFAVVVVVVVVVAVVEVLVVVVEVKGSKRVMWMWW